MQSPEIQLSNNAPPGQVRPIVHIGYHKTATTWLQRRLFPLAESHRTVPRSVVQEAFLAPAGLHFDAALAHRVLGVDGANRPLLLSEENLSGYLHNGGLHGLVAPEMARRIRQVLPDARILIVVRNQFDICRASYAQYVSGGGTWGQTRYFETARRVRGALTRPWKAPVFEYQHFEFDRLVDFYDALFGREQVIVYPYEWLFDGRAMTARLESDLGLVLSGWPQDYGRDNASLGAAAQMLLRGANLFTRQSVVNKDRIVNLPGGQVLRHAAKAALKRLPLVNRAAAGLSAPIRQRVSEHYPASNRRLLKLRDLPLAELGYPL